VKNSILIYGCYGYTGKLISQLAAQQQLPVILAGRDAEKTKALATQLNLPYVAFDLKNEADTVKALASVKVVLHCAGPFRYTAEPMAKACLKTKTHYLDITGEYDVFEKLFGMDKQAKNAGILIMPGTGFDVVPTDCLALYLKNKIPGVNTLELALMMKGGSLSHGTAITVAENLGDNTLVRRDGELEEIPNGSLIRSVLLPNNRRKKGVAISWGDISTAYRTTGIPNITVYNCLPDQVIKSMKWSNYLGFILRTRVVKNFLIKRIKNRPAGPNDEMREKATSAVWGEVRNEFGANYRAMIELPEGYTLTALTALKIAQNVLQTEPPHGTRTPASVFGADFILQFDKVKRIDL
jgi:short subunit dehydrogenase-like uncharacterized protein